MTAEDSASTAMIEEHSQQLASLTKSISAWRARLNQSSRVWDQKNSLLAAENARLATEHQTLQAYSQHKAKQQFCSLKRLCVER